jgi:hypothetical protein
MIAESRKKTEQLYRLWGARSTGDFQGYFFLIFQYVARRAHVHTDGFWSLDANFLHNIPVSPDVRATEIFSLKN